MNQPKKSGNKFIPFALVAVPTLCVALLMYFAMSLQPGMEESEEKLISPSGKMVAVWRHSNPKGKEMGKDEVYLLAAGKTRLKDPIFKAEKAAGLELKWLEGEPETLLISYETAWVHQYKNFWQDPKEWETIYQVKLEARSDAPLKP